MIHNKGKLGVDMRKIIKKRAHYIKFIVQQPPLLSGMPGYEDRSLEELLKLAVAQAQPTEVIERDLDVAGAKLALSIPSNQFCEYAGCITALLFASKTGKQVPGKKKDEKGVYVVPAQPVVHEGKEHDIQNVDPAENLICFAVCGEHLAYFSDYSGAEERLRTFIEWLLKSKAKILAHEAVIHTEKVFIVDPTVVLQFKDVSKFVYKFGHSSEKEELDFQMHSILENRLPRDPFLRAKFANAMKNCNMGLTVTLGRGSKGEKIEALKAFLGKLTPSELRKTTVHFSDNNTMTGNELQAKALISVKTKDGVWVQENGQEMIARWLNSLIMEGLV
ncbi:MAG: hypothetical protein IKV13_01230 [Akkermansia sp.]|nr:hypothetical protein [Akkermansia sp.]